MPDPLVRIYDLGRNRLVGLPLGTSSGQNKLMPHTLWRPSLVLALYQNRNAPNARFVQMATVRADGRPADRSLVFRGFLHETHQLTFATDTRGRKTAELAVSPRAELCWYF